MRYIDADALIAKGWRLERHAPNGTFISEMSIADVPTADVAEVVRCKDCEHWHCTGEGLLNERVGICGNDDFPFHCEQRPITRETDFCSYGEKEKRRKDAD